MTTLTPKQIQELEGQLKTRQTQLLAEIRNELAQSGDQHYIDLSGRVTDLGDESVADMLADLEAAHLDRQINDLRDIETALARIKAGEFGQCAECGDEVAFNRLQAYPTATRCIFCQEKHEKEYAGEGQHSL
ncbi:MAG: TraR/DksA family transcriptional regulator [Sulfuricella sp.]|nr:TraR/DksA family transcriptional regulator [Sulfuricella sp.]